MQLATVLLLAALGSVTWGERADAKTRVRGIDLSLEAASGLEDEASPGTHRGIEYTYGETASDPSRQYNGRVFDPGTGFHDYGARLYWPQIGRFISVDTYPGNVANPASLNRYSYVLNNPYKYVDSTGHFPEGGGGGIREELYLQAVRESNAACANGTGSCALQYTAAVVTGVMVVAPLVAALPEVVAGLAPAAPKVVDAASRLKDSTQQLSRAGQALLGAEPTGSALKGDLVHRAATFMREAAARTGTTFEIIGRDGATRTLTQVAGKLNDVAGRYEYIVDGAGKLTHQMFVAGGAINGIPIKP